MAYPIYRSILDETHKLVPRNSIIFTDAMKNLKLFFENRGVGLGQRGRGEVLRVTSLLTKDYFEKRLGKNSQIKPNSNLFNGVYSGISRDAQCTLRNHPTVQVGDDIVPTRSEKWLKT